MPISGSGADRRGCWGMLHRPDVPISGSLKFKGPKATPVSVEHILPQYPMPKSGNSSSNGAVRNEDNGSNGNGAGVPEGLSNLQAALGQSQAPQPSSEQLMEFQCMDLRSGAVGRVSMCCAPRAGAVRPARVRHDGSAGAVRHDVSACPYPLSSR
eukprot:2289293-Rhodomonas_salina.2